MSTAPATTRGPRALLIVLGVVLIAFMVSLVIVISVARAPSYEPVPVPSINRV